MVGHRDPKGTPWTGPREAERLTTGEPKIVRELRPSRRANSLMRSLLAKKLGRKA
jgi:hypothetical protein